MGVGLIWHEHRICSPKKRIACGRGGLSWVAARKIGEEAPGLASCQANRNTCNKQSRRKGLRIPLRARRRGLRRTCTPTDAQRRRGPLCRQVGDLHERYSASGHRPCGSYGISNVQKCIEHRQTLRISQRSCQSKMLTALKMIRKAGWRSISISWTARNSIGDGHPLWPARTTPWSL